MPYDAQHKQAPEDSDQQKSGQEQSSDKDKPSDADNRPIDNDAQKQSSGGSDKPAEPEVTSSKPASVVADVDRNSPQESSDRSPPGGDRDQAKDEKSGQETSSFSARADQEAMVKKTGTALR